MKKLYVTGIGPGGMDDCTMRADRALAESETVVGYTAYLDLVRGRFPDKEYVSTPMGGELARVRKAFGSAASGRTTCLICSGDAGVYGMAGPALFMADKYPDVSVEVIPGVTAATGAAAVLGAPLMNDFCAISLSDDLTPWEVIEKRLRAAAAGDFAIALYNPRSRRRPRTLACAVKILKDAGVPEETPCGLAGRIGREGAWSRLTTLEELADDEQIDMFTTVVIGNSRTHVKDGRLITARGYGGEEDGG